MLAARLSVAVLWLLDDVLLPRYVGGLIEESLMMGLQGPHSWRVTCDGRVQQLLMFPNSHRLRLCRLGCSASTSPCIASGARHENFGNHCMAARALAHFGFVIQHGQDGLGVDHADKLLHSIASVECQGKL